MRVPVPFTSVELVPRGSPPHVPALVGGTGALGDGSDATYVDADQDEVDGEVHLYFGPTGVPASQVVGIEWGIRGKALGVTFLSASLFPPDATFFDGQVISSERVHASSVRTFNDDSMRDYAVTADAAGDSPTSTSPGEWTWANPKPLDEVLTDGGFVFLTSVRQSGATTYRWRVTELTLALVTRGRTPLRVRQRSSGVR